MNRCLEPLGVQVVRSSTLADLRSQAHHLTAVLSRTHRDARESVTDSRNDSTAPERLAELHDAVEASHGPLVATSQWDDAYIGAEIDLENFRADGGFVWQHRDGNLAIHHVLTDLYLRTIDTLGLLERCEEDGAFGCETYLGVGGHPLSRDLLDSVSEILFLERTIGISSIHDLGILDVGAGYGRLAHRMAESLPNLANYLCADAIPEATYLADLYLRYRNLPDSVRSVRLDLLEDEVAATKIDCAVNIHSFTECPMAAIRWWLDLIARAEIEYLLIVPNSEQHGGTELCSKEADGKRLDFLPELTERGFDLVIEEPKYTDETIQEFGVSPTRRYLFERVD